MSKTQLVGVKGQCEEDGIFEGRNLGLCCNPFGDFGKSFKHKEKLLWDSLIALERLRGDKREF